MSQHPSPEISTAPQATLVENEQEDFTRALYEWYGLVRRFWYWFLLSSIIGLGVAFIYQQSRNREYSGQAVILIENSNNEQAGSLRSGRRSGMNALMQLNGINVGDNLQNEVFILSSLRLMKNVVGTLKLDVDYTMRQGLHQVALYRNRPFTVHFDKPSERYARMKVTVGEGGTFTLTDFEGVKETEGRAPITVRAGQAVTTPLGRLTITPDPGFDRFPKGEEVTVHHYSPEVAAHIYRSRLSASEYSKESSLITLTLTDINRERAEDILYEVTNVYKADIVDNKNRVAQRTADFIDERIKLISKELSQVEGRLSSFKQSNNIVDVAGTASTMTQQSLAAGQQVRQLSTELSVAQNLADFLRSTHGAKEVIPVVSNFGNSAVAAQIAEFNRLVMTRNRYADNSSAETPVVRDLDRQLESLRSAINSSLQNHVRGIEIQLRAAQGNEARFNSMASGVPVKEREVVDITRQQNLKEALYTYLLNRREEVALQLAIEEANVRLVENPIVSESPIRPRRMMILGIGLLLGLLFPAAVIWVLRYLDNTISSRQDIEEHTAIPVLGELPHIERTSDDTLVFGPGNAPNSPAAEAFRLLRYGLHFMSRTAKVFLVTSSSPGHGKSFVSRNLAASLALTGKRVILVDADIRVHNLSTNFAGRQALGLTEYLVGDHDRLSEIVMRDGVLPGVDFLPAGIVPPNVTELLMSDRLDRLAQELREHYDYVLFDTTPCFSVADAGIVSRVADVSIMVMRVGVQPKAGLRSITELHRSRKIGNICAIVNDCDMKARAYGYGYGYGYGYAPRRKKAWWKLW